MREYKHTTGPWECVGGAVYREGDEKAPIAYMCRDERATEAGISPVERDSNAVLIAAAPELLAALVMMVGYYGEHLGKYIPQALDAIAKAEGK